MATNHHKYVFDAALEMRDAGLVTASAASLVDGAAKILDLGLSMFEADLVIDVTVVEVATGNEKLEIEWQLSNSASFASGNVCATVVKIGDSTVNGSSADSTTGRYVQPVHNEFNGTIYRYARLYERYTGTIDTGYNFSAFLSKR